ncbi:beta-lactamase family protein [Flavihumibacter sediminis]|nr:beta-lactamase family protein [Flavihumibacter sediminis]
MRLVLFLPLLFFINVSYAQNKETLRDSIKNLLNDQKLSGAVWAIVSEDGEIAADAYGYKNVKTKEPLNASDKVFVGSVSKTILACGFLRMATVGSIDLDDPVKKYLPDLPLENPWENSDPVTIRQLLDHRSGLTDAKLWHVFSTSAKANTPLETVYLNSEGILRVHARPGSIYSYSNIGYTILGMVIEKIQQKPYEEYLDEEVLKPLEMINSSFQFISQTSDKQLAYGHFDDGEPVAALPMYLRPAGQFTTTAEDMGKFLRYLMGDGTINGKSFINNEYLASVGSQKFTDAFKYGVPFGDALGAYSRDRYGVVGIAKNGNTLGFAAMIYFFPKEKKAFFIAHNMDSETANYDLFNEAIVKYLGLPAHGFITIHQKVETEIENWNGYYVPVITKVEPFGLLDDLFSHTKVEITENGALLLPFQGKDKALIYQGHHLFSMEDRTHISHAFYKTTDGEHMITDGVKTIKKVMGLKIAAIAASLFLGLAGLIYMLIVGFINLAKYKSGFRRQPIFWLFVSILTMLVSIGLIATQPFMRMGDMTAGNILLALSTALMPVFSIVTMVSTLKTNRKGIYPMNFWASISVIQFCGLLITNDLMPLIMWR